MPALPHSVPDPEAAFRVIGGSPPLRLAAGLLLLGVGIVLTAGCLLLSLGLSREYGAGGAPIGPSLFVGAATAATLVSGLVLIGRWSRRVLAAVGITGLVLGLASPVLGVTIGGREHRADLARAATACSAADKTVLAGLPLGPSVSPPAGSRDGSCGIEVQVSGSPDGVRSALTAAGWRHTGDSDGASRFGRGHDSVQVVINEGEPAKGLTVRITIPPQP